MLLRPAAGWTGIPEIAATILVSTIAWIDLDILIIFGMALSLLVLGIVPSLDNLETRYYRTSIYLGLVYTEIDVDVTGGGGLSISAGICLV